MTIRPFAFVLMPFDEQFDDIYKLGIQSVASDLGIVAERVDEQNFSETILERIYRQIRDADFVIADMTGQNQNVFYEVGYAHALDKLCTLLTQSADDIPFDLKHHRHIIYDGSIQKLKAKLKSDLIWLKDQLNKRRSSPFSIELNSSDGYLTKIEYTATASVDFIFDIRNNTSNKSPDIDAIYFHIGKSWTIGQDSETCPSTTSDKKINFKRHFVKSPVPRISPGGWAQIKLVGEKQVWNKWSGDKIKDEYKFSGAVLMEIATAEGTFFEEVQAVTSCSEIPF